MKDKEKYIRSTKLLREVFFGIRNSSTCLAEGVTLEVEGVLTHGIEVAEELPQRPIRKRINKMPYIRPLWWHSHITPDVEIYGEEFRITVKFGTIQPGHISIMEMPVYLGAKKSEELHMNATVIANSLPIPTKSSLQIDFDVISKPPLELDFLRQ
ncbi:hypothetical protein [Myxosarcina sp. GI1(2024)]